MAHAGAMRPAGDIMADGTEKLEAALALFTVEGSCATAAPLRVYPGVVDTSAARATARNGADHRHR